MNGGKLPNSIFTDSIVGVGADSDSPNIVQKVGSKQVVWNKLAGILLTLKKYREPGREVDQRWLLIQ